jgi:uncharacterized protein
MSSEPLVTPGEPALTAETQTATVGQNSVGEAILKPGRDGALHLQGSRCPQCDDVRYPARTRCPNDLTETEPTDLSDDGTLYTAVRVELAPQGFEPPYWVGYVDLPERVRVFAPLRYEVDEQPRGGDAVRLVVGTVRDGVLAPMYERKEGGG